MPQVVDCQPKVLRSRLQLGRLSWTFYFRRFQGFLESLGKMASSMTQSSRGYC